MTINLNHSKLKQPESTNTFSLNTVTDTTKQGSDTNELGNILCLELNSQLAGQPVMLDRERFLFFLKNNSIWIINTTTCEATLHSQLDCFGWDTLDTELYPVTGTARIVRGCEYIVYAFTGVTKDIFINVDRPEKQQDELGVFDCDLFEFSRNITHPIILTEILNSGGSLSYGNYNFAIEFLSGNEDVIFTSEVDINYTPITISDKEGALNLSTNLPEIGGKPLSNKSIKITIDNVPEDASLARIIVFRHITSDGFTSDAHVIGQLILINGNTIEYLYTGFSTDNGDYLVDKNAYLVPKAIYESSLNAVQVNNRLLRYNLKETVRDYNNYQQKASLIEAKYVVNRINKTEKNLYLLNRTFLGGEIILPCINYVHRDGTVSNSYPLIGRQKLSSDEVLIDDILNPGQQVERWKYFDTSIKDSDVIEPYWSSGNFGYYESSQLYTNPPNYCGDNYWGSDSQGDSLEGLPVRLFVVPDRSVERHDSIFHIYPIGIWFDEDTIEYPNDDVVGHYFSITVVNESNIKAKGIGIPSALIPSENGITSFIEPGIASQVYGFGHDVTTFKFLSGNGDILEDFVDSDYTNLEGTWESIVVNEDTVLKKIFASGLPYDQIHIWSEEAQGTNYNPVTQEVKVVEDTIVIPSRTTVNDIENRNLSKDYTVLTLDSLFDNSDRFKYMSLKNDINPIPNIYSIVTRRITNLNETVSFDGDNFISPLNIDTIRTLQIEDTDVGSELFKFYYLGIFALFIDNEGKDIDAYVEYTTNFFTESKVNTYIRHEGTDTCNKHLQNPTNVIQYFLEKMVEPFDEKFKLRDEFCQFFPGYNKDYSYIQELNKYRPISLTFDFCSQCTGLYPHRMIFSPQSFSEDLSDSYRINLPNDHVDIPANTGAIIAIDFKDNKLVIRTERSCYFLQPNPQQMETSEANVYIGTGDFLSIPPQELSVTQEGYGGQQHKLDSINTGKALIWADRQAGIIHSLGGEYKEISKDMEKWFGDKLPVISHLIFGYDPVHDRILMTGKNSWTLSYCFKEQGWKSFHSYIPDWYIYNVDTFYSVLDTGLWEHNKGNFTTYYNLGFPHVVEMILKSEGNTFLPQSVIYHANTYDISNGYDQDVLDITYDQFLAYNDTQSTGIQDLILNDEDNIYYENTVTHVKQTDRNYKISPLKDLATSSNIWTTDISPIQQNGQGYFDYLPIVDINKSEVEIGSMRSKWLGVRLYFNNHSRKISLEYETGNLQNSIR